MPPPSSTATVYLVGAGPGDPGLLTLAAADALRRADVIVYDYLANPELLTLVPSHAEKIYVGKSANQHTKTQDEINAILVQKARELSQIENRKSKIENPVVVRLKGGDPYVFGRGGEEGEYLRTHNIPFIEIPGITAGIAAPAYAGIPVTHRDFTSTITLITGHERDNSEFRIQNSELKEETRVNYEALAKLNGTLVFYMGVKSLPQITQRLIAGGLSPETPAAVIRWGTHPKQQTVTATLATLAAEVELAKITAPAITIVGQVVSLRPTLNWFEQRPLFGQRILVTRTRQQASNLSAQLSALGAQVLEAPTIELLEPDDWADIDRTLQQIPAYDWVVFTSANGVRAAWSRLRHLTFDARHFGASNVAAVGPATAKALEEIGIIPDLLPDKFTGDDLAPALRQAIENRKSKVENERFLLLRADIARPVLREELEKLGARVDDLPIYQTQKPDSLPDNVLAAIDNDELDTVTFTSASTADNLWDLLTPARRAKIARIQRASIGPITTAALNSLGAGEWSPTIAATQHDIPGLVATLVNARSQK